MKIKSLLTRLLPLASLAPALLPGPAWAHPGHDLQSVLADHSVVGVMSGHYSGLLSGLLSGLMHPLTGLDHMLAMLATGMWAAQQNGRSRWMMPLCSVLMLVAGSLLGMQGVAIGAVEQMIMASVLVIGVMVAMSMQVSLFTGLMLAGSFAVFHGYAHGVEMQTSSTTYAYVAGFVIASLVLQALGALLMRRFMQRTPRVAQVSGAMIALCGVALCMGGL